MPMVLQTTINNWLWYFGTSQSWLTTMPRTWRILFLAWVLARRYSMEIWWAALHCPRSRFALHSALRSRVQAFGSAYFLAEFIILAMPLLLSMTLFAEAPGALSLLLLVLMFVLFFLPPIERGTPSPAENWDELALPNGRSRADTAPTHSPQSLRSLPADYLCSHDVNDNSVYTRCWFPSVSLYSSKVWDVWCFSNGYRLYVLSRRSVCDSNH